MSTNAKIGWGLAALAVVGCVWFYIAKNKTVKKADLGYTIAVIQKAPSIIPA